MRKTDHDYRKARHLRRTMTLPEGLLWLELRRKAAGVKFKRQHPVGPFVLDFYCPAAKLGIEINGIAHDAGNRPEQDEHRDAFLGSQSIGVVRIAAKDVLRSPLDVTEAIVAMCRERGT